ncbi:MAG: hypothetical protein ACKOSR_03380 [Flavobacteriales bacterium]
MFRLLFVLALFCALPCEQFAQKTTIVHHYPKDTTGLAAGKSFLLAVKNTASSSTTTNTPMKWH